MTLQQFLAILGLAILVAFPLGVWAARALDRKTFFHDGLPPPAADDRSWQRIWK